MAAITSAVVVAAGTAYAANKQAGAAKKGAQAQVTAAQLAADESRAARDQARQDQSTWLDLGQQAAGLQKNFLAGDTSGFENSAGYKFRVDQGFQGLNRGLAAQGAFAPGTAADADRIKLGQGLASDESSNYWNMISGVSNTGQNAASNVGAQGINTAQTIGGNMLAAGNAQAAGYANSANAIASGVNSLGQIGGALGGYFQQQGQQNMLAGGYGGYQPGQSQWSQQSFNQPTRLGDNYANFAAYRSA